MTFHKQSVVVRLRDADVLAAADYARRWLNRPCGMRSRAARGQSDPDTVQRQETFGKSAEFGVFRWLQSLGVCRVGPPDLRVYPPGKRSWTPDFRVWDVPLSVKSCEYRGTHGDYSWVFQIDPPDQGIFGDYDPQSLCVFVVVDDDAVEIKAVVRVEELHARNLFNDMVNMDLRNKMAVYADRLMSEFVPVDGAKFTVDNLKAML